MRKIFFLFLTIFILSCNKNDITWNLAKIDKLAILSTLNVVSITNNEAKINCQINLEGTSPILERGICISTSPNPTILINKYLSVSNANTYSIFITNLTINTTYFVRAFAKNKAGVSYGNQLTFSTLNTINSIPTISTSSISNVTINTAFSGGNISSDGGLTVTQRGVCWSTSPSPTTANGITNDGVGMGNFNSSLTGLVPNTRYYVRAYATNSLGTAYGVQLDFTTSNVAPSLPILSTTSVTNITSNSASCGGIITSDGGSPIIDRGICWTTFNRNPTISDFTNGTGFGSGIGSFTFPMSNLSSSYSYNVRAFATNSVGIAYGNTLNFATLPYVPPVASLVGSNDCSSLSSVSSLYYGINGTSAAWGISTTGYNGICWVAPNPNLSGNLGTVVGSNHYIQFNRTFANQGYIEFWVNTYNPGFNNLIPVIVVNGSAVGGATVIGGQTSSLYWMKVRSPVFPAGNNTIKFLLSGSYYVLKIDQIDFYEY
jgi:hypothetical protein